MLLVAVFALTNVAAVRADITQTDIDAYNAAVDAYNTRAQRHEQAAADFNNEAASYRHAVNHYNSLPSEQRTQFQRDRLQRWYTYLRQRLDILNHEWDYLTRRKSELDAWYARLQD